VSQAGLVNRLRQFRFEAGELTQQALAERAGVTRQTIIAIESGRYAPSLELALKLARIFRRPVEDVFSLNDA
jgi:putative transcriptional regulator